HKRRAHAGRHSRAGIPQRSRTESRPGTSQKPAAVTSIAMTEDIVHLTLPPHILCVDDEEGILSALRQQLSARFGRECDIEVAQSAHDALELMDEIEAEGEDLAVVIADQIMPGMKGVEFLEEVN